MRNRTNTLLILLALAFGVFFLANRYVNAKPAPSEGSKRSWEYCHLYSPQYVKGNEYKSPFKTASTPEGHFDWVDSSGDPVSALNNLGADGWELVAIINQSEYILKRPKP